MCSCGAALTQTALPLERMPDVPRGLDWGEFAVLAETVGGVGDAIVQFWRTRDIEKVQRRCGRVSREFLSAEHFPRQFVDIYRSKLKLDQGGRVPGG